MIFSVENEHEGVWRVLDTAVEAVAHQQAVARACTVPGLYRVRALSGSEQRPKHFWVPLRGPPRPLPAME